MLKFEQVGPKDWNVYRSDNEKYLISLLTSTVTNKFHLVAEYIQRVSEYFGDSFDKWLMNLLNDYKKSNTSVAVLNDNIETLKVFVDDYLNHLNIDYNQFVDESKAKKNSILFRGNEIKEIIRLSNYLKIYSLFSLRSDIDIGAKNHRNIYNKLADKLIDSDVIKKIHDVVKTKTFRYNLSDKFMWEYIKTVQCRDINTHIAEIFNFIMNNIIILCEENKNPITYFVGVVDESVKWFLRSVYKGKIVYNDEISTEDIHGIHINNLRNYSFNDTLGRLKTIAFEKIYEKLDQENAMTFNDKTDQYIIDFQNRLSSIEFISPLCQCLVFPILSVMTKISYVHFKTINPEHSAVLSYYLSRLMQRVFKVDFKNLVSLLDFYPESQPSLNTTYKIKSIHEFIDIQDKTKNFYGFNTKIPPHKHICHFVGRVSRINFTHLLTGQKLSGIPLTKVETDMVHFFTLYFSGKLKPKIEEMIELMNFDF